MLRSRFANCILNQIPFNVFEDLCCNLNVEGPCNWKHVARTLQEKEHFFSDNDFIFLCNSRMSAFGMVRKIVERQVTVAFLLQYLDALPCNCASNALLNSLEKYFEMNSLMPNIQSSTGYYSHERVMSVPMPRPVMPYNHPVQDRCHSFAAGSPLPYGMRYPVDHLHHMDQHSHQIPPTMAQKPIKILEQPKDQQISQVNCGILRFRVETELPDITYQWYHNDKLIADETNPILFLQNNSVETIGNYYCVAKSPSMGHSPIGSTRSRTAFVDSRCEITQHVSEFNASDKIALLVGNDLYQNNRRLPAVSRDIRVLSKIFKEELHFRTLSFENLNFTEMHRVLLLLIDLSLMGCYCVFFFGGHGYENDGQCYLVPTDAPSKYDSSHCIKAHSALEDVQRRREPNMMLILLDICRKSNPYDKGGNSSSRNSFTDNVVFAYATTENSEAYEERDGHFGIFVESLQKHLKKPIRVNHMLSYVQDDVRKSDVQFMEVKTLLSTNRCLTDRLEPGEGYSAAHSKWKEIHEVPDLPLLIQCKENGISFAVAMKSVLTNCVEISSTVEDSNNFHLCEVVIRVDRIEDQNLSVSDREGFDVTPSAKYSQSTVQVRNLQKLDDVDLKVSFLLRHQITPGDDICEKTYSYKFPISVSRFWKAQLGRPQR